MRGIQSSKVQELLASGGSKDFSSIGQGIVGVYPQADGVMTYSPEGGDASIPMNVFAGNPPPIMGKINITATDVDLIICL